MYEVVKLCLHRESLLSLLCLSDVQKFPLRMKDNDLLVTELYRDPTEDAITALSVYLTPKTSRELFTIQLLLLLKAGYQTAVLFW